MKQVCLLFCLLSISIVGLAQDFTAADKALIKALRDEVVSGCKEGSQKKIASGKFIANTAYLKWGYEPFLSPDYCACVADRYAQSITIENLRRNPDDPDDPEFDDRSNSHACLLSKQKQLLPIYCKQIVLEFSEHLRKKTDKLGLGRICQCVERKFDELKVDAYVPFMKATGIDFNHYLRSLQLPDQDSESLPGYLVRCGLPTGRGKR